MSKHLGNILEPFALMDKHGADALRWYMLAGGSPWAARRIGDEVLEEVVRKVLLTYWNTASFFVLYANASGWTPGAAPVPDARGATAARPLGDLRTARHRARGRRGAGGLRFGPRGPPARAVHRRPVELVRPAIAPPVLGRRPGGAVDAARVPRGAHPADGAVHAVHHRGGAPAPGRRRLADAAGLGAPARLAAGRRRAGRRRAGRADGAGAPAGRARPVGPRRVQGAHPPAARTRARARAGLGRAARTSCADQVIDELNVRRRSRRRQRRPWLVDTVGQSRTSGRSASASAMDSRRWRRRSRRPTPSCSSPRCGRRHGGRRGRRREVTVTADELVVTETPR